MSIDDFAEKLRRIADEKPREFAQAQADRVQTVYDRVLRNGAGKSEDEVKDLLAQEWRTTFGTDPTDPDLSNTAKILAAGQRIRVTPEVRG